MILRILLLGTNGQLGWELQQILMPLAEVVAPKRHELNLLNLSALANIIKTLKPAVIINAAAYTLVDKAEQEINLAYQINATALGVLANEVSSYGGLLIHYSTDYVFDGNSSSPYKETHRPNPLNVYGKSKLAGEQLIINSECNYVILRTSWVYAAHGHNFIKTILKLAAEREQLTIVSDQLGTPTSAAFIAYVTTHLLRVLIFNQEKDKPIKELYHLTALGHTNWFNYAQLIVHTAQKCGAQLRAKLIPISSSDYQSAALRPQYSLLDSSKLCQHYAITLPAWEHDVRHTVLKLVTKLESPLPLPKVSLVKD